MLRLLSLSAPTEASCSSRDERTAKTATLTRRQSRMRPTPVGLLWEATSEIPDADAGRVRAIVVLGHDSHEGPWPHLCEEPRGGVLAFQGTPRMISSGSSPCRPSRAPSSQPEALDWHRARAPLPSATSRWDQPGSRSSSREATARRDQIAF